MKTLTKEEIIARITGRRIESVNEGCFNLTVSESLHTMQEFSDQQTANLKLINEKQAGLIEALSAYSTHVVIMWSKELDDDESKDLKLRLWHEIKRIKSALAELSKEPTELASKKAGKEMGVAGAINSKPCGLYKTS